MAHPTDPPRLSLDFSVALGLLVAAVLGLPDRATALEQSGFLAQAPLDDLQDIDYWRTRCQLQTAAQKYPEAQVSCEAALRLRPEDADLWTAHSHILLALAQYPEALASTQQALALVPANSLALTHQCLAEFELGQFELARQACGQAVQVNRRWGETSPVTAWLYQGRALAQQQDYTGALVAYERALLSDRQNSQVLTYRCAAYLGLEQYDSALNSCAAALTADAAWRDTSPALAWSYQGIAHQQQQDYTAAVTAFDQALRLQPQAAPTWLAQGQALAALDRDAEALLSTHRAVALQPDWSQALGQQCTLLNQTAQYEAALVACNQALAGNGAWGEAGMAQAWSQQAQAFTGLGQYPAALAAANRAVGLNPTYAEAWNNRGAIQGYLEDWPGAIASLQRATELAPTYTSPWVNLGRLQRQLGNYDQALSAYDQALERAPQNAEIWANRSSVQWYLQQYEAALTSADRAISLDQHTYLGWYNRATALFSLERYREAGRAYQQAMRLDPTSADAWTGMGVVLARLQRYDEARRVLAKALALNPQQAVAQATWQELLRE